MMEADTTCPRCGAPLHAERLGSVCAACLLLGAADDLPAEASLGRLAGHELIEVIARGGMGIVYRARQRETGREVALKALPGAELLSDEARQRFKIEAEAMARLEHPAVLPIHELGEEDGTPFFTMKLARGGSLAARIASYRGKWREIAELLAQVAEAAHYAHERGVLHRDLKPGNILFDENGQIQVSDFGLAKIAGAESDLTRTIALMGTPNYMAPELTRGGKGAATTACDVWSLGVMLYELLAGQPPFHGDNLATVLRQLNEEATPPLPREVPRDLAVITRKALQKTPAERYASAAELADDLRRWLRGEPILARAVSPVGRMILWVRRHPARAALFALSLAAAGVAVAALAWGLAASKREIEQVAAARASERELLRQALLNQARFGRIARRSGWRQSGLEAIRQAAAISPGDDLRNEAIAHLAGFDLVQMEGEDITQLSGDLDGDFERFASVMSGAAGTSSNLGIRYLFDPTGRWFLSPGEKGRELKRLGDRTVLAAWPRVIQARCTGDGRLLAVHAPGDRLILFDTMELREVGSLKVGKLMPGGLALPDSADENLAATVTMEGSECTVRVIDWHSGEARFSWKLAGRLSCMVWRGGWLVCGNDKGNLRVIDLRDPAGSRDIPAHADSISTLCFTADGQFVSAASMDGHSSVWHLESGQLVLRSTEIHPIAFGRDGRLVHGTNHRGGLARWESSEGFRLMANPTLRHGPHQGADFSPDGRWLSVWGGYDAQGGAAIHDVESGRVLSTVATDHAIIGASFMPAGDSLLIVDRESARVLPLEIREGLLQTGGGRDLPLPLPEAVNLSASMSPDRGRVALAQLLDPARRRISRGQLLDLQNIDAGWRAFSNPEYAWSVQPSPEGRWLAQTPGLRVWDAVKLTPGRELSPRESSGAFNSNARGGSLAHSAAFSPDGKWLAEARLGMLSIHETGTWERVHEEQAPFFAGTSPPCITWSHHSRWLAVQDQSHGVRFVEAGTWRTLWRLNGILEQRVAALKFHPSDQSLCVVRQTGSVEMWDLVQLSQELADLGLPITLPPPSPLKEIPPALRGAVRAASARSFSAHAGRSER